MHLWRRHWLSSSALSVFSRENSGWVCGQFLLKTHPHRVYSRDRTDSNLQPVRKDFWHLTGKRWFFCENLGMIISLDETHLLTLAVGLVTILGLILLKRFAQKVPGTLVALIVAIIVSSYFNLAGYGVAVVGQVMSGLPELQIR